MLTLYQAARAWGTPNISPFCIKLETYLRMAQIPYETKAGNPRAAPKGKIPYIELEGRKMGDSTLIIEHLKQRYGDKVDAHLSAEQRAVGRLLQRTLEEGTYWIGVYTRWVDDENFEETRRTLFGSFMGPPLIWIVPDLVRKRVLGTLYGQGISRHDRAQVEATARSDFEAISVVLGEKPYLFGEQPSSYDAVLFAFASALFKPPFRHGVGAPPDNVRAHMERMHARYFPELT